MNDELLQAMWKAYWTAPEAGDSGMRAVLDVLHANGYRRCAEGQRTTQWCERAEDAHKAQRQAENDLSKYMARAAMAEAEVERLQQYVREREMLHAQSLDAAAAEVERLRAAIEAADSMAASYGRGELNGWEVDLYVRRRAARGES